MSATHFQRPGLTGAAQPRRAVESLNTLGMADRSMTAGQGVPGRDGDRAVAGAGAVAVAGGDDLLGQSRTYRPRRSPSC
ncbi:hypothetical protein ACFZAM_00475 [Streptomyces sp. NPDC008079]|uniref:hypothetical protein n=1 Tax=Streptomyces sp. NPDC008079 TaxID=3364806 RepID=UPI0036E792A7